MHLLPFLKACRVPDARVHEAGGCPFQLPQDPDNKGQRGSTGLRNPTEFQGAPSQRPSKKPFRFKADMYQAPYNFSLIS